MDRLEMVEMENILVNGNSKCDNKQGLEWTNEKHSSFLSSMESSFVKSMLDRSCNNSYENYGNFTKKNIRTRTRLDRFIPDIGESTLDSQPRRSVTKDAIRVIVGNSTQRQLSRSHPYRFSLDQVVPQLEDKVNDKDEN